MLAMTTVMMMSIVIVMIRAPCVALDLLPAGSWLGDKYWVCDIGVDDDDNGDDKDDDIDHR